MYSQVYFKLLNHCYFKRRKEEAISARPTTDFNRTQGSTRNNSTILKEERSPRSSKMINPTKTQHLFDDMLNILGREGKTQPWEEPRRTQQTGATSKSPSPMVSKSNLIAKAPTEVWGPNKHSPVEILRKETASFKPREEKNNCQAIPGYQVESKENVKERYKKYENLKVAAAQNRRTHREDKGKYEKGDFTKFLDRK
jgi:hypothetical protein